MTRPNTIASRMITAFAASLALASLAHAQQVSSAQGRMDFARIHALNAATQTSLRNRAQDAARDARSVVDGARIHCDVTHARLIGYTRSDNMLVEIACKASHGFIVDTSTPSPRAFDCRVLAAGVAEARKAGKQPPPNAICQLPENAR